MKGIERHLVLSIETQRRDGHLDDQQHVVWLRMTVAIEIGTPSQESEVKGLTPGETTAETTDAAASARRN